MPFNSIAYLILIAGVLIALKYTQRPAWVLIIASLFFYSVAGSYDLAIFLVAALVNWLIQIIITAPRLRIMAAVFANIGLIVFFKYKSLLLEGLPGTTGSYIDIALPLGISFYCFQVLAYQIDVVRGQTPPASSLKSFFLFIAFFPQLIAGPIVRAHQLLPQIERLFIPIMQRPRLVTLGLGLFVLGLVKKIIFADSLAPHVDESFAILPSSAFDAWMSAVLFGFQIYFDFSGYSDMAIGSAYLLGIRLPINFRTPYLSSGPREFWQRWHISLSGWIRDYLYIPLGGSRGGLLRSGVILLMTMAIAGLWHGANFTFILWGAIWGIYILIGRLFNANRFPYFLRWPLHISLVMLLWVLFRAPSLEYAISYWSIMIGFPLDLVSGFDKKIVQNLDTLSSIFMPVLGVVALFIFHLVEKLVEGKQVLYVMRRYNGEVMRGFLLGLIIFLVLIPSEHINPFIYFRF